VIQAMNDNLPFDQFTTEQLAGDLLPGLSVAQKIATGFHRTVTCNVEAGVHPEENRMNQVFDRVNTTATVWLGLTLECSQCHNHKYDPLPQAEYYKMLAYFNNTPVEVRNPSGKGVSFDFYGPKMDLPLPASSAEPKSAFDAERATLIAERTALTKNPRPGFGAWVASFKKKGSAPSWQALDLVSFKSNGKDTHKVLDDGSILLGGPVPQTVVHTYTFNNEIEGIRAFRVDALTHPSLPGTGPGRGDPTRTNFILSELAVADGAGSSIALHGAVADFSQTGWPVANALDGYRKTGWAIAPQFKKPHWAVFKTTTPVNAEQLAFTLDQNYGSGRVLGRVKISATTSASVENMSDLDGKVVAILNKDQKKWTAAERKQLEKVWRDLNPRKAKLNTAISKIDAERKKIAPPSTLVMVEKDEPRMTHVLNRGNYLDKKEQVAAGTPAVLHPLDPALPPNRLGLAQWIMDPDNPLVARVTVNRWWHELFGLGLVETLEDFGTQAAPPSHPELLDWLAREFVENGWDRKQLLRTIVLSDAYQQSSRIVPEAAATDPDNRWLTRGSRFRLDAETIRDNALAASGLLSPQMFGKPIMPFQPDKVWRQVGRNEPKWVEQTDHNRWRRGIYIVYRRAAPYPSMVNFDAPDRGACTVKRARTNTPLQALTLMNDPVYVEAAFALAQRVLAEPGVGNSPPATFAERLDFAFICVLARPASSAERAFLAGVHQEQLARFSADQTAAAALVAGTKGVLRPTASAPELAAWFHLTSTLLNLDEAMTKE